jgi:hypothetical protein
VAHPLDSVRQKLIRGSELLKILRKEIEAFRWSYPYAITGDFDANTNEYIFRVKVLESPPDRLAIIGGDCIHNFRSALDQLVHRLVEFNGNTPTRRTQFPIVDQAADFPGHASPQVVGLNPDHLALIESMQSYHGGTPEYSISLASAIGQLGTHPLTLLRDLSNHDKHRDVHVLVSRGGVGTARLEIVRDAPAIGEFVPQVGDTMSDGAEVGRISITNPGANPVVILHGDMVPSLALTNEQPYDECVFQCQRVAEGVFRTFVSALGKR